LFNLDFISFFLSLLFLTVYLHIPESILFYMHTAVVISKGGVYLKRMQAEQ